MGIVFGAVVPHPPLLIPDVGLGQEKAISRTIEAMNALAEKLAQAQPQSLIVISPHGAGFADAFGVLTAPESRGHMGNWGSHLPESIFSNDPELVAALQAEARRAHLPLKSLGDKGYELDHGVMVPMHFLQEKVTGVPLLPLTFSWLPLPLHFAFGQALKLAAAQVGKRVAVIASGDLSHRLTPSAPAGYDPEGQVFDRKMSQVVATMDREALLSLDPLLVERAGECGLRSITILFGALSDLEVKPEVLSYEGPFGVGYLVAAIAVAGPKPLHPAVKLARDTVESYVRTGRAPDAGPLPPELSGKAGVFVSIKKFGELRGCIGTFEPTRASIASEIIANAIFSATQDPRFYPVTAEELPYLCYSVDILTRPVKVEDKSTLDPKRFGLIVERGQRRGLLLPDLEGVDTVEEQLHICCLKAGLAPDEPLTLYCFEVRRYK